MQKFLIFLHQKKAIVANLMIGENVVREKQQLSISSQNQTETTTEPK